MLRHEERSGHWNIFYKHDFPSLGLILLESRLVYIADHPLDNAYTFFHPCFEIQNYTCCKHLLRTKQG